MNGSSVADTAPNSEGTQEKGMPPLHLGCFVAFSLEGEDVSAYNHSAEWEGPPIGGGGSPMEGATDGGTSEEPEFQAGTGGLWWREE